MDVDNNKNEKKEKIGQVEDVRGNCYCQRCGKSFKAINFYAYKDGSKCQFCKPCLTAHVDNFNPETFIWILKKIDVPYVPTEWNKIRDKAFAKNPKKMNGMSVVGKYLALMRMKQWLNYSFADTEKIQQELYGKELKLREAEEKEKEAYEAELKVKLSEGKISLAEYQTLVRTETQNKELQNGQGNLITGEQYANPSPFSQAKNPFQEQNFLPESEFMDFGTRLPKEDKVYLALKWGRLYRPEQWIALEKLYNEFMNSFDIQGAARIDTLKMICKTSLKMNEAIDIGDVESYQKLSKVYDTMMKSAKFTEAQNKDANGDKIDSASAIVDFVESHTGNIPRYQCDQPQDIVDQIINDLKAYNKSLIYEDKSLAQEIEKYLQDKKIAEEMRRDRKEAKEKGLDFIELEDKDLNDYRENLREKKNHDNNLTDDIMEQQYRNRRGNKE